jgi:hypothetical protein
MFAAVLVAVQQMALVGRVTAEIVLIPCIDLVSLPIVALLSQGPMSSLFSLVVGYGTPFYACYATDVGLSADLLRPTFLL